MSTKDDADMNISLKFGRDQSEIIIKRQKCDEAVRDLEVLVSPEGVLSPEFLRHEKYSIKVTHKLKRSSILVKMPTD
eukprot:7748445-Ditylum_brightwellii.AAC.1